MTKKLIRITAINRDQRFVEIKLKGIKNGIVFGLSEDRDGLAISYKGDLSIIPFKATLEELHKINGDIINE